MVTSPVLAISALETDDVESYLRQHTEVLVTHRRHDSGNTSAVVEADGARWFVKWSSEPAAIPHLESAIRFHQSIRHPAIAALRGWFSTPSGLALVHDWVPGEVLYDPLVPGSLPRDHPGSAFARFRRLATAEILDAISVILDAHAAVTAHGFVPVDFYDGSIIYHFGTRAVRLCDLDSYRPGPYVLEADRQFGSRRFMAPEEFRKGATIDERTTVFILGRTAYVLLSRGDRGEQDAHLWPAGPLLRRVAERATRLDPGDRYEAFADFNAAWQAARDQTAAR